MLVQGMLECIAPVNRYSGGDAEICQTAPPNHERQGILQRLKAPQKAVALDRHTRAGGGGPRLLQVGNHALEVHGTALTALADSNVRIDDHDSPDALRQ